MKQIASPINMEICKSLAHKFLYGFSIAHFLCVIAWLPTILQHKGMDAQMAGFMLLMVQVIGQPFTFFCP